MNEKKLPLPIVKQLRRMFNKNKQVIFERTRLIETDFGYAVADFDLVTNHINITTVMEPNTYVKFMKDNPNNVPLDGFYMVIYCHRKLSHAGIERCFVEHLYQYLISDVGCFTPDGSTDFYLNYYMDYTTPEINRMCRNFEELK
jgi:hypothetical protein